MIDATTHQQLGTLIAEVKSLREDFRRAEDKSDASRASVQRRMDEMVNRVGKVDGQSRRSMKRSPR
jgi:hypothetical protein